MSDELSPEMLEEAAPDLLTLEDEDGKEVTFEVIDATEVNGTRYLAVIPYQEDPESLQEDAELILMRIGTDEEGEYMDIVADDEELITGGKVFEARLRAALFCVRYPLQRWQPLPGPVGQKGTAGACVYGKFRPPHHPHLCQSLRGYILIPL